MREEIKNQEILQRQLKPKWNKAHFQQQVLKIKMLIELSQKTQNLCRICNKMNTEIFMKSRINMEAIRIKRSSSITKMLNKINLRVMSQRCSHNFLVMTKIIILMIKNRAHQTLLLKMTEAKAKKVFFQEILIMEILLKKSSFNL